MPSTRPALLHDFFRTGIICLSVSRVVAFNYPQVHGPGSFLVRMAVTSALGTLKVNEYCDTEPLDIPVYKVSSDFSTIHNFG